MIQNKFLKVTVKLIGLLLFVSISCDDTLHKLPKTAISSQVAFDTPARILGQVNGLYKSLKNVDFYGEKELLLMDVRGEEFINVTANPITGYVSWNNSCTAGDIDVNNLWTAAYTTINNANVLIDGLTNTKGIISDSVKINYIAEARFIRALSYFCLVSIYARPYTEDMGASKAIPLRLLPETSTANNDLARSTVAEIYRQILTDLDFAEANLPSNYSTVLLNTTRAHRNSAIALKTRVYLNRAEFSNVLSEATKIVPQTVAPFAATSGVKHQLQDILTIFSSDYTTTESIFSMPMTVNDCYSGQSALGYVLNSNAEYYLNPSGILGDAQWSSLDIRRQLLRNLSGKYYLKKFAKTAPFVDFIPVIRYAEILLNAAEAAARLGNITFAQELLKAVHHRSDKAFVFANPDISTKDALLKTILKERRIELLGEGFRSNDLLRNLEEIPAKGSSSMQVGAIAPSSANYIYPLPNSEINTNKLLLQ